MCLHASVFLRTVISYCCSLLVNTMSFRYLDIRKIRNYCHYLKHLIYFNNIEKRYVVNKKRKSYSVQARCKHFNSLSLINALVFFYFYNLIVKHRKKIFSYLLLKSEFLTQNLLWFKTYKRSEFFHKARLSLSIANFSIKLITCDFIFKSVFIKTKFVLLSEQGDTLHRNLSS